MLRKVALLLVVVLVTVSARWLVCDHSCVVERAPSPACHDGEHGVDGRATSVDARHACDHDSDAIVLAAPGVNSSLFLRGEWLPAATASVPLIGETGVLARHLAHPPGRHAASLSPAPINLRI